MSQLDQRSAKTQRVYEGVVASYIRDISSRPVRREPGATNKIRLMYCPAGDRHGSSRFGGASAVSAAGGAPAPLAAA